MDFECNAELLLIQAINFITFELISPAALRVVSLLSLFVSWNL